MKPKQIREMTDEELERQARELRREGFNLRMQQTTGQLANPARMNQARRDTARLLTEQTARRQKAAATTDGK